MHPVHNRENKKPVLANRTIYSLVWYTLYNLRPGNGVPSGPYSHNPRAHMGPRTAKKKKMKLV